MRALRGNPAKTEGTMRDVDGRCCLCVIEDSCIGQGLHQPLNDGNMPYDETAEFIGWEKPNPILRKDHVDARTAAHFNDSSLYGPHGMPHKQIADLFEASFPQLTDWRYTPNIHTTEGMPFYHIWGA